MIEEKQESWFWLIVKIDQDFYSKIYSYNQTQCRDPPIIMIAFENKQQAR